ncbi:MAG: hypothetical protein A2096_06720 [Spirochaetes bacterium GWF1_41_5]|nr:MAG: hypothetical protein A2096_06720 [Spirochaetes bacterium GWF1_41_5]HBE02148.1 two-component system response regulator [Spirochaetia bacterium]
MLHTIALIEDDSDLREIISQHLTQACFTVKAYSIASLFLKEIDELSPSAVVLDLTLPDYDGFEICKIIRNSVLTRNLPIIIISGRTKESDKILGLEIGADDYLAKPFSCRELEARLKAVLRRNKHDRSGMRIINNWVSIDLRRHLLVVNNEIMELTPCEFKIMILLSEQPGWVYSRDQILQRLWGNGKIVIDRTIDVHITHLREKLGQQAKILKNIRGAGYRLE